MSEIIRRLFAELHELTEQLADSIAADDGMVEDQKMLFGKISYLLDDLYLEMEKTFDSGSPEIAAIEQCECAVAQVSPALLTKDQKDALVFALRKLAAGPANRIACDEIELSFLRANLEVPTFSSQLFEV